jgi:uncharacterized protein DUF4145
MAKRLTHRCGRCGEKAELEIIAHTTVSDDEVASDLLANSLNVEKLLNRTDFVSLMCVCPRCSGATIIDFQVDKFFGGSFLHDLTVDRDEIVRPSTSVEKIGFYPSRNSWREISGVPQDVCELMEEIEDLIGNGHRPSVILSTIGTALELVMCRLGEEKGTLFKRIDSLADRGVITNTLKQWAHHLRERRNKAVHEAVGSKEDADELFKFLCTLVEVTIGLPHRIEKLDQGSPAAPNGHPEGSDPQPS